MAQYGQGFYGEMRYGVLGANYGTYTSYELVTPGEFRFTSGMAINIRYRDTKVTYKPDAVAQDGIDVFDIPDASQWVKVGTSYKALVDNAKIILTFAGANVDLDYTSPNTIDCSSEALDEDKVLTTASYTLPVKSVSGNYGLPNYAYANYKITLTCSTDTIINSADIFVCGVSLELRRANASTDLAKAAWIDLRNVSEISSTLVPGTTNVYSRILSFNADDLTGYSRFQYAATLYSSDSDQATYVDEIEVISTNSDLYMASCEYIAEIDMASELGSNFVDFKQHDTIEWTENVPDGTVIDIRTAAGNTTNQMSAKSPRYVMGGYQARLKPDATNGFMITPRLNFDVLNSGRSNINTTKDALLDKVKIKYTLGSVTGSVSNILYSIYVDGKQVNTMTKLDGSKQDVSGYNIDAADNKNAQVRIEFNRSELAFSPSVDAVSVSAKCVYYESIDKSNYTISAVDQLKTMLNTDALSFFLNSHPKIDSATFTVSSAYAAANNYVLYFDETTGINRSATLKIQSGSSSNIICYSKDVISVSKRSQKLYYGNGTYDEVNDTYTTSLKFINNFEPALVQDNGKKYLYNIYNNNIDVVKQGDMYKIAPNTIDTTVQYSFTNHITSRPTYTYNTAINYPDGTPAETTVTVVAKFDDSLDIIPWTSEEKIFNCNINVLGDKEDLIVTIDPLPTLSEDAFFETYDVMTYDKFINGTDNVQIAKIGPYEFSILKNSVFKIPKPGSSISAPITNIEIKSLSLVKSDTGVTVGATMLKGSNVDAPLVDLIPSPSIDSVSKVSYGTTIYSQNIHWTFDENLRAIVWIAGQDAPPKNAKYNIEYIYRPYQYGQIVLSCDYNEVVTENSTWASTTKNEITGSCPYNKTLTYDLLTRFPKTSVYWPDLDLIDNSDGVVLLDTIRYFIHSTNNEYVQCYIDSTGNKAVANLGGMNPAEDWMLKINSGFYYLGADEYYKYNNKISARVDQDIPIITDCDYVTSTSKTGAIVCHDEIKSVALNNSFINQINGISKNVLPTSSYTFDSDNAVAKAFWISEGVM